MIIGIGGSATNDRGVGMVQALGAKLLDKDGEEIGFGGGELKKIFRIDTKYLDNRLSETKVLIASDVSNPLCGPKGFARVYRSQM